MSLIKPKSKLIPIAAGLFVLILLVGFSLGLRTVIEFDPANAQMRTTKYLLLKLPVSTKSEMLWLTTADMPYATPDWHLMHEFHHSAAGSKIHHTHWGAFADTIILWSELNLEPDARSHLAQQTTALVDDDALHIKSKRIYARRIDAQLRFQLDDPETIMTPSLIDTIIEAAYARPIENDASMLPDP